MSSLPSPPPTITAARNTWRPVEAAGRRHEGFHPWDVILIVNLLLVGLLLLSTLVEGPADVNETFPDADSGLVRAAVHMSNFLSLLVFGGLPIVWLLVTRSVPIEGTLQWLRLKTDSQRTWPFWAGIACLLSVALVGFALLFGTLMGAFGVEGGDPLFEYILSHADWFVIIGISIAAGVGEEIMFRGVLQKKLGWIGQGVLFGAAHINQGFAAAIFIALLSMVFGYLVHRGAPLWSMMLAHALYDFILLTMGKLELG